MNDTLLMVKEFKGDVDFLEVSHFSGKGKISKNKTGSAGIEGTNPFQELGRY
jgi:hypothetical protein